VARETIADLRREAFKEVADTLPARAIDRQRDSRRAATNFTELRRIYCVIEKVVSHAQR
jgi:hypothetical protein